MPLPWIRSSGHISLLSGERGGVPIQVVVRIGIARRVKLVLYCLISRVEHPDQGWDAAAVIAHRRSFRGSPAIHMPTPVPWKTCRGDQFNPPGDLKAKKKERKKGRASRAVIMGD